MASTTRDLIEQDVVRIFSEDDEAMAGLPVPLTTTSGGTTSTAIVARLNFGTKHNDSYNGRMIKNLTNVGDAVHIAAVVDGGFSTSVDTISLSPSLTSAIDSGDSVLMYPRNFGPDLIVNTINDVLRVTQGPNIWFPSLVSDSDFAAGNVTAWTGVGTPSTAANFVTSASNVLLGPGSINAIADAATEGFQSNTFNVHETEQLTVSVFVFANVGSVIVQLYNETGASVTKAVTIDEPAWTQVQFSEPVPADCEQMRIRFVSAAASDDFYVGAHVIVQPNTFHNYVFPSWLLSRGQITGTFHLPTGMVSEDADSYVALSERFRDAREPDIIRDDRAVNAGWLHTKATSLGPIGFYAYRPFAEITTAAGTTTTPADREYIVWRTVTTIMERRGDGRFTLYRAKARARAKALRYGGRRLTIEEAPPVAV